MKRFLIISALILALGVVTLGYLISPRRDAEVALNLKWLPWSAKHLLVNRDVWTDYVVRGYVEVAPEDFERIIRLRRYEPMDHAKRPLSKEPLPAGKALTSTRSYYWHATDTHCELRCDETRTWLWFIYSTD